MITELTLNLDDGLACSIALEHGFSGGQDVSVGLEAGYADFLRTPGLD